MSTLHVINSLKKCFDCDKVVKLKTTRNPVFKCTKNNSNYFVKVFRNSTRDSCSVAKEIHFSMECNKVAAKFVDKIISDGYVFVISEFLDGYLSMMQMIEGEITLSDGIIHKTIVNFIAAVKYIHSKHILHRDIKPGNVMVNQENGDVKLIDFEMSESDDDYGSNVGTYDFIDPNFVMRYKRSLRISFEDMISYELFACGVTLFQFLGKVQSFNEIEEDDDENPSHYLKLSMSFPSMNLILPYDIYPLFSFNVSTCKIDYDKFPISARKYPTF